MFFSVLISIHYFKHGSDNSKRQGDLRGNLHRFLRAAVAVKKQIEHKHNETKHHENKTESKTFTKITKHTFLYVSINIYN